nr:MAG TPA: major capsid protein [Caudoviricetes sp.]
MSTNIDVAFVEQYKANVESLLQQKGSKLRGLVSQESVRGKDAYFEQIGSVAAVKKTTRHADTPRLDTPHKRRRLTLETYNWADLIDNDDKVRMLIDPTSEYSQAAAWAMGRAIDEAIVDAALGTAATGEKGTELVSLPAKQVVDSAGASGFTFDKLREVKRVFDSNEVPSENRYIVLSAYQLDNLLSETKVTSADFASAKALVRGEIDSFMGFRFIQLNGKRADGELILPEAASKVRACLAFQRDGVKLGIGQDVTAKITERDDKCYATQVYYEMSIGATRMQEETVVQVNCKEGA